MVDETGSSGLPKRVFKNERDPYNGCWSRVVISKRLDNRESLRKYGSVHGNQRYFASRLSRADREDSC